MLHGHVIHLAYRVSDTVWTRIRVDTQEYAPTRELLFGYAVDTPVSLHRHAFASNPENLDKIEGEGNRTLVTQGSFTPLNQPC